MPTELPGPDGLTRVERELLVRGQTSLGIMVSGTDLRALNQALRSLGRLRLQRLEDLLSDLRGASTDA